ncbi:MAG TPA: ATP-binding protein [Chloroflexota bacterium]|nr:ATP-binding protein [Chloroflexota bacterium]
MAPMILFVLVTGATQRQVAFQQIHDQALREAQFVAGEQARLQDSARETLAVLAQLPAVRSEDRDGCAATLARILALETLPYGNFGVADPSGAVICSAVDAGRDVSVADLEYFQRAATTGQFSVGEYRVSRFTGQPSLTYAYPLLDSDGATSMILFATMNLTWLGGAAAKSSLPDDATLSIVDRRGVILARYPDPEGIVGEQDARADATFALLANQNRAKLEGIGPNGTEQLIGAVPTTNGSAYISVAIPAAGATSGAARILLTGFLAVAAVGVVAIAASWLIAELAILRPVRSLVSAARRLGSGDLGARSGIPYSLGELGELAQAFDQAAEELKDQSEQMRQTQKLEALGLLAGGIAHDFNNLVTGIIGFSGLVLAKLPSDDPLHTFVDQIQAAGERAANLTRQLLAFSRRQPLEPQVLDLNTVVAELEHLLRRAIGEDIELVTQLDPEIGNIEADRGQIEQVLVNLAVNARDAMPQGGKITIKTGTAVLSEEYVRQHEGAQVGHHVMLAVTDTGIGMDAETQKRIFEPFFTTKEPGKGTGLGLSTAYGIVKQSGGTIWVYSEPGHGTTFRIYLPRVDRPVTMAGRQGAPERLPEGTETVLLVEDDKIVRTFATTVLQSLGYHVYVASNAMDALAILSRRQDSIDLLITDLVMPGMGGRELAEKVTAQRPAIRVLFMSGFDPETRIGQRAVPYGKVFLAKPFTDLALSQKVREALVG